MSKKPGVSPRTDKWPPTPRRRHTPPSVPSQPGIRALLGSRARRAYHPAGLPGSTSSPSHGIEQSPGHHLRPSPAWAWAPVPVPAAAALAGATIPPQASYAVRRTRTSRNPGKCKCPETGLRVDGSACAADYDRAEFQPERWRELQSGTLDRSRFYLCQKTFWVRQITGVASM